MEVPLSSSSVRCLAGGGHQGKPSTSWGGGWAACPSSPSVVAEPREPSPGFGSNPGEFILGVKVVRGLGEESGNVWGNVLTTIAA